MNKLAHIFKECDCEDTGFQCFCSLAWCAICDAAEGELLTYCPGYLLSEEAREACYHGNVVDLERARERREYYARQ